MNGDSPYKTLPSQERCGVCGAMLTQMTSLWNSATAPIPTPTSVSLEQAPRLTPAQIVGPRSSSESQLESINATEPFPFRLGPVTEIDGTGALVRGHGQGVRPFW